ncbi:energy-coupling factor ABC transporter ATP-binding protein [Saliphagus sp. LR7]|uniref:energy-coupling factor ABC transporter ATP-binding protein n=1 Tax=Saliphagus sp. LR7 TaxID=2282654 RepID=UPI000DF7512A|nr:ABC transporter ATP-binding protein [Saliphagus sp. LR7]
MIEFRNVTHRFGDVTAIAGLSLTLGDGEFVVLAGTNGSGKTTLLGHCNGLLVPDEGRVLVDGHDVADEPVAVRRRVGMVFQHPRDQFVAATVGEDVAFGPANLGHPREEIDRRVERALAAVGMGSRTEEAIEALSGGEQSRVAIAGALAMEPTHLVLDEPFAGLDEPARRSVLARLEELSASGTAILVATHDLRDVLELADRVVGMSEGAVVLDRAPADGLGDLDGIGVRVPGC